MRSSVVIPRLILSLVANQPVLSFFRFGKNKAHKASTSGSALETEAKAYLDSSDINYSTADVPDVDPPRVDSEISQFLGAWWNNHVASAPVLWLQQHDLTEVGPRGGGYAISPQDIGFLSPMYNIHKQFPRGEEPAPEQRQQTITCLLGAFNIAGNMRTETLEENVLLVHFMGVLSDITYARDNLLPKWQKAIQWVAHVGLEALVKTWQTRNSGGELLRIMARHLLKVWADREPISRGL